MSSFIKNVEFATAGIKYFFKNERNGRIQGLIAIVVIALACIAGLSRMEWCIILVCIAMVIGLEMINTALERVGEMLSIEYHPMVKIIKDVAAGAIFWVVIFSSIIGAIIFLPYLKNLAGF